MHALSIADWKSWRSDFNRLPFVRAVAEAPFPKSWLPWWRHSRVSALLETGKAGRYTIFAPQFELLIACNAASSLLLHLRKGVPTTAENVEGSPFETLRNLTSSYRAPKLDRFPPFLGGWIGFLSYDLVRLLEQIPETAARDLDVPFAGFGLAEEAFVYDHKQSILFCCTHFKVSKKTTDSDLEAGFSAAQIRTEEMRRLWEKRVHESHAIPTPTPARAAPPSPGRLSFSREEFVKAVQHVQDRIRAGETYQTNLSIRETRPLRATPEAVYEKLRQINPSPYMGLLRLPDFSLVSGSPELLIRLHNGNSRHARSLAPGPADPTPRQIARYPTN